MQFKLTFVAAALATLAVATPTSSPPPSCSTGTQQCCQSTTTVANASSVLLGLVQTLLGVAAGDITGLIGAQCTSVAGSACSSQTVCCTDNAVGGLVSIGCIPISV